MDAATTLRTAIPDFPGYGNEDDRRRADELVRARLGEALAGLQGRATLSGDDAKVMSELLLRAGFRNQLAFKAFEYASLDESVAGQVAENDARLVDLAVRAAVVDQGDLPSFLIDVKAAFDRRDRTMQTVPA